MDSRRFVQALYDVIQVRSKLATAHGEDPYRWPPSSTGGLDRIHELDVDAGLEAAYDQAIGEAARALALAAEIQRAQEERALAH